MNGKTILFAFLTFGFLALTGWAVIEAGSLEAIWNFVRSPIGLQVSADLCTSLTIGAVWMWGDARRRGLNPLPYVIALLFLGSGALLLYLTLRNVSTGAHARHPVVQAA